MNGMFLYVEDANEFDEYKKFKRLVVPDLGRLVIKTWVFLSTLFFFKNIIFSISNNDLLINFLFSIKS